MIFVNKRVAYDRSQVLGLDSSIINTDYSYSVKTEHSNELVIFESAKGKQLKLKREKVNLISLGKNVVRKALATIPAFKFNELIQLFPNLKSIDEFITSEDYLGKISIIVSAREGVFNNIPQVEKLKMAQKTLLRVADQLNVHRVDYQGTKEFLPKTINALYEHDKILNIANDGITEQEFGIGQNDTKNQDLQLDLSNKDWFVFNENYGTSEEKYFVRFLETMISDLKKKYDDVYLLRNEKHFKLYSFDDGRAFEPDFLLLLTKKEQGIELTYQVFVEPKGSHLIDKDKWKQDFLIELKAKHKIDQVWTDKKYIVWGLPFYTNESRKVVFEPEFTSLLN
ncbi:hypothetical protein D0N37_16565 [Pseudoalteromonas piscicida]|nr:hypothetical protein D0N37_16565 [Pseudoalteromonas piscicida]